MTTFDLSDMRSPIQKSAAHRSLATVLFCLILGFTTCLPANTIRPLDDFKTLTTGIVDINDSNLRLIAGTILTTGLLFLSDQALLESIARLKNPVVDDILGTAKYFGNGYAVAGAGSFLVLGGLIVNNKHMKTLGVYVLEGFAYSSLCVTAVKFLAGRARPWTGRGPYFFEPFHYTDEFTSFYSGHTTEAFTLASVFAHYFPTPAMGIVAYTLATLTGIERIYSSKHWPADVFIGAVTGILIGGHIVKKNGAFKEISMDSTGFRISFSFKGP
jgi:membrane-associated phospholipid phosphatase